MRAPDCTRAASWTLYVIQSRSCLFHSCVLTFRAGPSICGRGWDLCSIRDKVQKIYCRAGGIPGLVTLWAAQVLTQHVVMVTVVAKETTLTSTSEFPLSLLARPAMKVDRL